MRTFFSNARQPAEGIQTMINNCDLSVGEGEFIEKNCARSPKAHDYSTTEIVIVLEINSHSTIPGNPTHR